MCRVGRTSAGLAVLVLLGSAGCTGGSVGSSAPTASTTGTPPATESSPSPSPSPSSSSDSVGEMFDDPLEAFLRKCELSLQTQQWRPAQVSYPESMHLEVGQPQTYNVAVDIRSDPAPADQVIHASDPTSEAVQVQCVISARLVPVGDHLEVETSDQGDQRDGWSLQRFTPTGTVEWAWTVTATEPESGGFRLVLRPAAITEQEIAVGATSEQTYETDVEVTGSFLTEATHWFATEFPLLQSLAVTVGAAIIGLLAWFGGLRTKWRELRRRPAPAADAPGAADPARSTGTPPTSAGRSPSRRKRARGRR